MNILGVKCVLNYFRCETSLQIFYVSIRYKQILAVKCVRKYFRRQMGEKIF